jgi:hypothetical protein
VTSYAITHVKRSWAHFRHARPGERFERFHDEHNREARPWKRPVYLVCGVASLAVGTVLLFIPGPAVVFLALAAALFATQSRWVACRLDGAELKLRGWVHALRARSRRV